MLLRHTLKGEETLILSPRDLKYCTSCRHAEPMAGDAANDPRTFFRYRDFCADIARMEAGYHYGTCWKGLLFEISLATFSNRNVALGCFWELQRMHIRVTHVSSSQNSILYIMKVGHQEVVAGSLQNEYQKR